MLTSLLNNFQLQTVSSSSGATSPAPSSGLPPLGRESAAAHPASKLSSEVLFKSANFDLFRELFAHLSECIDEYHAALFAQQQLQQLHPQTSADAAQLTKSSNGEVEKMFYLFWTELVLRALPRNIAYFHSSKVLSCDVKCLLSELLSNARATMACNEDEYMAGKAALSESLDAELVHFLTVEEFIVFFNEQLAAASNPLLLAFYKELLLDESPVFHDLLRRHCKILEYWAC